MGIKEILNKHLEESAIFLIEKDIRQEYLKSLTTEEGILSDESICELICEDEKCLWKREDNTYTCESIEETRPVAKAQAAIDNEKCEEKVAITRKNTREELIDTLYELLELSDENPQGAIPVNLKQILQALRNE